MSLMIDNPAVQAQKQLLYYNIQQTQERQAYMANSGGINFRSSMIDRVHKAKPGCSSCGKK
jgi:hypothetical protein